MAFLQLEMEREDMCALYCMLYSHPWAKELLITPECTVATMETTNYRKVNITRFN